MFKTYRTTRIESDDDIIVVETEQTAADYIESVKLTINGKESNIGRTAVGALIHALQDHT